MKELSDAEAECVEAMLGKINRNLDEYD